MGIVGEDLEGRENHNFGEVQQLEKVEGLKCLIKVLENYYYDWI